MRFVIEGQAWLFANNRLAQSEATPSAAVVHEQPVVLRISVQSDAPGNETAWHPTDQPVFSQGLDQSGRNLLNETSENESRPFRPVLLLAL